MCVCVCVCVCVCACMCVCVTQEAIARYNLADKGLHEESGADKQSYALGVKEV